MHGAWAETGRYLSACGEGEPTLLDIEQPTGGSRLEFRVNRDVIVLNNLTNGNAWLVDSDLRLVDNWEEVTPPEESEEEEGEEKSSQQTFEDTLAERTDQNRPPLARDDEYGVRPGRTTILEVLENDTDPDGDVLTVASTTDVSEASGRLELIDGGRALQFSPAEGAAGSVSFRYSVDDGRAGVAEASVNVRIVPESENAAPVSIRSGAVSVEQGQKISYNVLADWNDPDGDDLYLVNASPTGGDSVRSSPDGFLTFEHKSAELGLKEVKFTVSDGQTTAAGTLVVEVKPAGSLNPIGTPDFAQVFVGETELIEPLANDLSPSGAALELLGVEGVPDGASVTPNLERGTIAFSSGEPGEYIFLYNLGAGATVSVGLLRVQVTEPPEVAPAPIAVKDTAYLRPGEPLSVPVLANDVSPSGRVLAVQSIDDAATEGLVSVEILTNTVTRVTASAALDRQLQFAYTVSDGVNSSTATVTVVPVPPLVKHQPPVALNDGINVRAGDIVTVPVLANDYHPDAAALHVLPDLADTDALAGLAFVDGDTVRYQAPEQPGVYTAVYTIGDDFEQTARATVSFTVVRPRRRREPRAAAHAAHLAHVRRVRGQDRRAARRPRPRRRLGDAHGHHRRPEPRPRHRAHEHLVHVRGVLGLGRHRRVLLRAARHVRRHGDRHDPHRRDPASGGAVAPDGGRRHDRDEARAAPPRSRCCSTTPTRAGSSCTSPTCPRSTRASRPRSATVDGSSSRLPTPRAPTRSATRSRTATAAPTRRSCRSRSPKTR